MVNSLSYLNSCGSCGGGYNYLLDGDIGSMSFGMGMNGSIFPGMMGGGFGMMGPGSEIYNMNQKDYLNYNKELSEMQMANQTDLRKKAKSAYFQEHSYDNSVSSIAQALHRQILDNEQDKARTLYGSLTEAVKNKQAAYGYTIPDNLIKAEVEKEYAGVTQTKMLDDLEENGDGSFLKGLKGGLFGSELWLTPKTSAQENIAMITGVGVNKTDKAKKIMGEICGGILTVAAIPFVLLAAKFGGKGILKSFAFGLKSLFSKGAKAAT